MTKRADVRPSLSVGGQLVRVMPTLIKRVKQHFHRLSKETLGGGAEVDVEAGSIHVSAIVHTHTHTRIICLKREKKLRWDGFTEEVKKTSGFIYLFINVYMIKWLVVRDEKQIRRVKRRIFQM